MSNALPVILIAGAVGLLFILLGLRANRKKRLLQNLPTCKTTGVFIGLVELKGTAESEVPFTCFLTERKCVHYRWHVSERWSKMVTERYTDSKGKRRTRRRRKSGWRTVAQGGETQPFYLRDNEGYVLVRPRGSDLEPDRVFSETCSPSDPLYYAKGPREAISHSDHVRSFQEEAICLHTPIFVIGRARERSDIVAPEIAEDKSAPMFLVTTKTERQVTGGYAGAAWAWILFGFLIVTGAGFFSTNREYGGSNEQTTLLIGLGSGYFLAWAIGWVWTVHNSLIDLRNRVRRAWSHVDVQLKRRHDLIPQLLKVVQSLKNHEKKVHEQIALIRSQQTATAPDEVGDDFQSLRTSLLAIQENHPELKTSEAYSSLRQQLVNTENRIALAKDYFNTIATHYNTRIEQAPDRYVAGLSGLKPRRLMMADAFERQPLEVEFAD